MLTRIEDVKYQIKLHDFAEITDDDIASISIEGRDPFVFTLQQFLNLSPEVTDRNYFRRIIHLFETKYDLDYIYYLMDCMSRALNDTQDDRELVAAFNPTYQDDLISTMEWGACKRLLDYTVSIAPYERGEDQFYFEQMARLTPLTEQLNEIVKKINPPILIVYT